MNEEIKNYLDKKIYSAKKTGLALALCAAATLAMTGCGKENEGSMFPEPMSVAMQEEQTSISPDTYRLVTEEGYKDFVVKDIITGSYQGRVYTNYVTEEGLIIKFSNNGCSIIEEKGLENTYIATYTNAHIEKLDKPFEWTEILEEEKASNTLDYQTTSKEHTIEIGN